MFSSHYYTLFTLLKEIKKKNKKFKIGRVAIQSYYNGNMEVFERA